MPRSDRHHHHHPHQGPRGACAEPSQVWVRRRAALARRSEERRTRYLLLGVICMIPGLMLYFGGGYLFVAAYNGQFPFVNVLVGAALKRIFWYLGPIFFFIGLIVFVVAYASFCRGIDYQEH